jgi:hypothetical protein
MMGVDSRVFRSRQRKRKLDGDPETVSGSLRTTVDRRVAMIRSSSRVLPIGDFRKATRTGVW